MIKDQCNNCKKYMSAACTHNIVFDSLPFVLIAFLGVVTTKELLLMIVFQYCSKLVIEAVFGTPMAYAAIRTIRKYVDVEGQE